MQVIRSEVAGDPVTIHVVESEDDLEGFRDFIRGNLDVLGLDSETSGLEIYADSTRLRLVQFGNAFESWVVPVEAGPRFAADVGLALRGVNRFVLHNASFDLQVFDKHLGIPMEDMWPKVTDTQILAHLVDPRGREDGGFGHKLEDVTRHYLDKEVADNVKTLMTKLAKKHKTTKAKIWALVPFEDEDYRLYSGMDPILAIRLMYRLSPLVPQVSRNLVEQEHQIAEVCAMMERTGFLLDVDYTRELSARLEDREDYFVSRAAEFGCENVNSTEQVADVLEARGERITERTPSGKRKVDKTLLGRLVKSGDAFAEAVVEAKKARKWRETWVDKFFLTRDSEDRCHAHINALRARTARMSITGIPAQTLPSGDWMIRRCFIADEGHLLASVDYKAQELRVLAALSGDDTMRHAFEVGADLHQITADASGVDRKVGKMANFLTVYGGGPVALATQADIDAGTAKHVLDAFNQTYPGVLQFSRKMEAEARRNGYIITPVGRRIPVDSGRFFAALNYIVQSTSRDVTCRALLRLHDAGFTPYLRLPIHDEIVASLPADHAEWGAKRIGQIMKEEMRGVLIDTDPEVGGRSWGSFYVKPEELASITDPYLLRAA
ncbi:DNA polymerase i pola1 [Nocardia farcinica]|uniref:DNA polymerase n=1 Tax=Nocardia farcinica TaxID=37329 RepID=UPI000E05409B|nr:DNA polymerase [Nocardia farcinica]SUE29566.1 DNA polymerase i pola1 [Nocardia farcinica]